MRSIRRQLTLLLLIGILASVALAGTTLWVTVEDALLSQFDSHLADKAISIGSYLDLEGEYLEVDEEIGSMPEFEPGDDAQYFGIWFNTGTEILRSPSLGEEALPLKAGEDGAPLYWNLVLPDGRKGRAVGLGVTLIPELDDDDDDDDDLEDGEIAEVESLGPLPITLVVAKSREDLDASLAALTTGLLVAAGVALLLLWWGVTFSVRRGLAPLRKLGNELEQIDAHSLSRRVDSNVPEELAPFAHKLNGLFERLELSFAKERRVSAGMAHELRTPIAELRSVSDVARRWPDDHEMRDEVIVAAGEVALRMGNSVEAMMRYCHLESGHAEPDCEPIELAALIQDLWKPYEALAQERGVTLRVEVPADVLVETDRGLLSVMLNNLMHNAACFASAGEARAWTVAADATQTLHVSNVTDQLTEDDVGHLSEAFWRKDAARSSGSHSGLGLTLVVSIAAVLGHGLSFAIEDGRFVVSIEMEISKVGSGKAKSTNGFHLKPES